MRGISIGCTNIMGTHGRIFIARGLARGARCVTDANVNKHRTSPGMLIRVSACTITNLGPRRVRFLCTPARLGPACRCNIDFRHKACISCNSQHRIFVSNATDVGGGKRMMCPNSVHERARQV